MSGVAGGAGTDSAGERELAKIDRLSGPADIVASRMICPLRVLYQLIWHLLVM